MYLPLLVVVCESLICAVLLQAPLYPCNSTFHPSSDDGDDVAHPRELFRCGVPPYINEALPLKLYNESPSVRETAGDRTDPDDGSQGLTEKRHEGLTEADNGEEIGREH